MLYKSKSRTRPTKPRNKWDEGKSRRPEMERNAGIAKERIPPVSKSVMTIAVTTKPHSRASICENFLLIALACSILSSCAFKALCRPLAEEGLRLCDRRSRNCSLGGAEKHELEV